MNKFIKFMIMDHIERTKIPYCIEYKSKQKWYSIPEFWIKLSILFIPIFWIIIVYIANH